MGSWCPLERYRSPEARARDKPTVSPSGRSFATSTRATGARLKLCQAVGRFPAEISSPPLIPHDARTRAYRELAARKVDVCLAVGTERALRAALLAAEGKPIVLLAIDFDPVARGYVASLSRPGGNVTGIFVRQLELAAKRVEIAREAFP